MHPLPKKDLQITAEDQVKIKTMLFLRTIDTIVQYASFIWDYARFTVGTNVALYNEENGYWYGQVEAIYVHEIEHEVIEAVVKIAWYEIEKEKTDNHPATYRKSGMSDLHKPQVIAGNVLVIPNIIDNDGSVFIQPHFVRYYTRYIKK